MRLGNFKFREGFGVLLATRMTILSIKVARIAIICLLNGSVWFGGSLSSSKLT